jgi:hypothetical protein
VKNSPTETRVVENFLRNSLSPDEIMALEALTKRIWRSRNSIPEQSFAESGEAFPADDPPAAPNPLLSEGQSAGYH